MKFEYKATLFFAIFTSVMEIVFVSVGLPWWYVPLAVLATACVVCGALWVAI